MTPPTQTLSRWERARAEADVRIELPGGIPMLFRPIPAGDFRMGSRGNRANEEPIHRVVITREFLLGKFVVTQEQYEAVARRCPALKKSPRPSHFKGDRLPVEQVSWDDAVAFCEWLAKWKRLPKDIRQVRLPTEAEWEYACRAGTDTEYYNGDGETALAEVAWLNGNADSRTHPVGERPERHPAGLYGMHGNVWEWCRDAYDAEAYRPRLEGVENPEVKASRDSLDRVLRGGSWGSSADLCRSAFRRWFGPGARYWFLGFRVCLVRGPAAVRKDKAEPAPAPWIWQKNSCPAKRGRKSFEIMAVIE